MATKLFVGKLSFDTAKKVLTLDGSGVIVSAARPKEDNQRLNAGNPRSW